MRASGLRFRLAASSSETRTVAEAPSVIPEELPAVIVPVSLKTGESFFMSASGGFDPGARERLFDCDNSEVRRAQRGERAAEFSNRCADCGGDKDRSHTLVYYNRTREMGRPKNSPRSGREVDGIPERA